jgi:hypothetical protein
MAAEKTPFELEPEDEGPEERAEKEPAPKPRKEPAPLQPFEVEEPPEDIPSRAPPPGVSAPRVPAPTPAPEDGEVDERTVAERLGRDVPRVTERLPNPADWPQEVVTFPFRRPGPAFIALGMATLLVFDLVGSLQALQFPSWVAKLLLLVYLLRAQFHVIGTSAAGHDDPRGWREALAFDREDLKNYWRTLLMFAGALAPGTLLFVFEKIGIGVAVLVVGSMYASVVALGAALRDPALKWPWHAVAWMGARPLHCLVGSLAWWALIGTELALHGLRDDGLGVIGFVSLVLRFACLYLILGCARVLGVTGRRWRAPS